MAQRWIWQIGSVREKRGTGGVVLWLLPTNASRPYWMKGSDIWSCLWAEFGNQSSVFAPALLGYVHTTPAIFVGGRRVIVVCAFWPEGVTRPRKGDFVRPALEMSTLLPRLRSLGLAVCSIEEALSVLEGESPQRNRLEQRLAQLTAERENLSELLRDREAAWGHRTYPYTNQERCAKGQMPWSW